MNYAFLTGQHNKVHHSYIWLSSLLGVGAAFFIALLSSLESIVPILATAGPSIFMVLGIGLLAFIVIYAIMVGVSALAYKNLSFVFDATEFSLYSGILTKRRVHVPYTRVQSVNHRQSLIQRLAGVCTVEIDTAGGAANKAIKVPYVKLDVGEAIRSDLFMRKAVSLAEAEGRPLSQVGTSMGAAAPGMPAAPGTPVAGAMPAAPGTPVAGAMPAASNANLLDEAALGLGVDNFRGIYGGDFMGLEPVSFERRLSNGELALASVSHSGVTATLVSLVVVIACFVIIAAFFAREILPFVPLAIPFIILGFVFLLGLMVATTALSFGSFSVRRRGTRIEVERGILQRDFSGIDVNRIQTVVVRQSFIRRLLGYCEVSLGRIRAGGGEDQNTQASLNAGALVVHPFLKIDQVDSLITGLLPEFADRPTSVQFKGLPNIALRRGIVRRCIWRNGLFWLIAFTIVGQIIFNIFYPRMGLGGSPLGQQLSQMVNVSCVLLYIVFVIQIVLVVLGTIWWKRGSGFAMTQKYLAICNDGLSTETVYLPRQKIQDVFTRTNPFQRAAHVSTIGALTAAGVQGSYSVLWDVTEEDASAWLDWLKPRTNVVE